MLCAWNPLKFIEMSEFSHYKTWELQKLTLNILILIKISQCLLHLQVYAESVQNKKITTRRRKFRWNNEKYE